MIDRILTISYNYNYLKLVNIVKLNDEDFFSDVVKNIIAYVSIMHNIFYDLFYWENVKRNLSFVTKTNIIDLI